MANLLIFLLILCVRFQPTDWPDDPGLLDQRGITSPDGLYIVGYPSDVSKGLWLWDANTTEAIRLLFAEVQPFQSIYQIAFSPDSRKILGADNNRIFVWDIYSTEEHIIPIGHSLFGGFAFSPGGDRFAARTSNLIYIWNMDTLEQIPTSPVEIDSIQQYALSRTDLFVVTDDTLHRHNLLDGSGIDQESLYMRSVKDLIIASDGVTAVYVGCQQTNGNGSYCSDSTLAVWDSNSGELRTTLAILVNANRVEFSPQEKSLILRGCGSYSYVSTIALCGENGLIEFDRRTLKPYHQSYRVIEDFP